ncbi:sumo-activating enzyme subunit 2 [Pelomyxa schiedti]|nr:sumo-activating enzyme subunit 2 [Pelomyxa schiedti]
MSNSTAVGSARVLVVGAGGIGCELVKDLALCGFRGVTVADLDTIDLSNLNRQFLFRRNHIGSSKAKVACEAVNKMRPSANFVPLHTNIKSPDLGANFFQEFDLVINALDNLDARRHVNRLCVSLGKPLIESATEGYLGQLTTILPGETECFECQPKQAPKSFAVCTIRSNPSEPVHCIHWAKMLFGHIWGVQDDSNAVTDLTTIVSQPGQSPTNMALAIFDKVFNKDIVTLASMDKLWTGRKPPTPLVFDEVVSASSTSSSSPTDLQAVWSIATCCHKFVESVVELAAYSATLSQKLVWDKDHPASLCFVTCAANIRAHIFGIPMQSQFDVKAVAGNIIPAIATSNAIVAGMVAIEAMKVVTGNKAACKMVFLRRYPANKQFFLPSRISPPNPRCFVCSHKCIDLRIDTIACTLTHFAEAVLKRILSFNMPSVMKESTIIFETGDDMDEYEAANYARQKVKTLHQVGIVDNTLLTVEDLTQDFTLDIHIVHTKFAPVEGEDDKLFEIDAGQVQVPEAKPTAAATTPAVAPTVSTTTEADDDDDCCVVVLPQKRKH